ncbi:MAG: hypothetical protein FJY09_07055 [Chlorobi bacterium]|nr:hypothetical protein [Chlorobiota bacterium]
MKQIVSDQDCMHLDERVAETEEPTGTRIVLSVIQRSKVDAELRRKST